MQAATWPQRQKPDRQLAIGPVDAAAHKHIDLTAAKADTENNSKLSPDPMPKMKLPRAAELLPATLLLLLLLLPTFANAEEGLQSASLASSGEGRKLLDRRGAAGGGVLAGGGRHGAVGYKNDIAYVSDVRAAENASSLEVIRFREAGFLKIIRMKMIWKIKDSKDKDDLKDSVGIPTYARRHENRFLCRLQPMKPVLTPA